MADLIERTEELILAVNAGARAIENTKRYHGATYCLDVFSDKPKEIPYLKAAQILREFDELPAVDAVEVVHGYNTGRARWFECSVCGYGFNDMFLLDESDDMLEPKYCGHCGAKMDGERREEDAAD